MLSSLQLCRDHVFQNESTDCASGSSCISTEPLTVFGGESPATQDRRGSRMCKKLIRPGTDHLFIDIPKNQTSVRDTYSSGGPNLDSRLPLPKNSSPLTDTSTSCQEPSLQTVLSTGGELTPEPGSLTTAPVFQSSGDFDYEPQNQVPGVESCSVDSSCDACCSSGDKRIPGTCITLQDSESVTYAFDCSTQEHFTCKVFNLKEYRQRLSPYFFLDYDLAILHLVKVHEDPVGGKAYALFEVNDGGDLHSYIRQKKRLREDEARQLLEPIFQTIASCHENDFLVRQLKLRQCVFLDHTRTQLVLQGLEDGKAMLENSNDVIHDRSGCPAYVSPEVVSHTDGYSGCAADVWAAGVLLYTALVGKYPFQTSSTSSLLAQVRQAKYSLPAWLSLPARDLLSAMLCRDPAQRIDMDTALAHPWFKRKLKTTPRPVPAGIAQAPSPTKRRKGKPQLLSKDSFVETGFEVPDSQEAFFAQACL